MSTRMTPEEFIEKGKLYVSRLFEGICEYPFTIAAHPLSQVIRFIVKLENGDYEAIKYTNLYPSVQSIVSRMGSIRTDLNGRPFNSELKLFDPYFDGLDYKKVKDKTPIWT
jgi:hypothetical protein